MRTLPRTLRLIAFGGVGSLSIAYACALGACSSDSDGDVFPAGDSDGSTDGGSGGEAAAQPDGGGGNDTGVSLVDSAQPDAGACSANEPLVSKGYKPACGACLTGSCCDEMKACEALPDCQSFAQCYAGCFVDGGTQQACTATCIAGKDGGAIQAIYNELVICGGKHCHNDGGAGGTACPY